MTDLRNRFIEFWQRNPDGSGALATWAELASSLDSIKSIGFEALLSLVWGFFGDTRQLDWLTGDGPGVQGGTDYGTWKQVRDYAEAIGIVDKIRINSGRATQPGGYLFWQPEFEDP